MIAKTFRFFLGIFCLILGALAILAALLALCVIAVLASIQIRGGPVLPGDVRLLIRGAGLLLTAATVLGGLWWLTRHVFGKEVFAGSFTQVASKSGKTERLALSISTVLLLGIGGLLIYERTGGSEWVRSIQVLGWLLFLFLGMHVRVLLHELGHLSAAQIQQIQPLKIQIGTGPLVWSRTSRGALRWEWRLWPQIGFVLAHNKPGRGFKWRQIVFVAAGPFMDALMIYTSYKAILHAFGGLFDAFTENAFGVGIVILFWLTLASAINGLIPHRIHLGAQHLYTDGYWLFHLCFLSNEKAQEFVKRKQWEQLEELAKQARMYFEASREIRG